MRKLLTFLLFTLTTAALAAPPPPFAPDRHEVKDGILYDARKPLHDVEVMVQNAKAAEVKK